MEDSYRSPLSQEFYPNQVSNYFMPLNVTKVEKILNRLMQEYCQMYFLNDVASSVFFNDQTSNHASYLMLRKELKNDVIQSGFYQCRVFVDIASGSTLRNGVLEYHLHMLDEEGSTRTVSGTIVRTEDRKNKIEGSKPLDIKTFNPKDVGSLFSKLEMSMFDQLSNLVYKNRTNINIESRLPLMEDRKQYEDSIRFSRDVKKALEGMQAKTGMGRREGTMLNKAVVGLVRPDLK